MSITIYNEITQEEHEKYEAIYDLFCDGYEIDKKDLKKAFSYFVLKSYLLEKGKI